MPCMVSESCSFTPASSNVGTSGSAADRLADVTASPRNVPAFTCGEVGGSALNAIGVCPEMADWIAGAAPPNGTLVASRWKESLNSSAASWGVVPMPGLAIVYLPGSFFSRSINSFTDFAGNDECTTRILGEAAASVIGAKSLYGSYGAFA